MADSTIKAIDRVFDLIDSVVGSTDHALDRVKRTEDQHRASRAKKAAPEVIDTTAAVKAPPSSSTAIAPARRFRIVESTTPETGVMIFVVTNGVQRAECTTRELAEKILRGLETSS